jgi:hypothetical protein
VLTIELARELKAAGVGWMPERGDWVYLERQGMTVLVHDALVVCGRLVLETDRGDLALDGPDEATWRPRLDQLLQRLGERGEFVALDWSEGLWRCYGNASGVVLAQAATAEEACARALLEALRAQQEAGDGPHPPAVWPAKPASPLQRVLCPLVLLVARLLPGQRAALDWAATLLVTFFVLGFVLMAAALAVWLGLRLLDVPIVVPAAT